MEIGNHRDRHNMDSRTCEYALASLNFQNSYYSYYTKINVKHYDCLLLKKKRHLMRSLAVLACWVGRCLSAAI